MASQTCLVCHITENHWAEVKKAIEKSKNNRSLDEEKFNFKSTPICSIKTPNGEEPLCLNDIERMYEKNFPAWNDSFQCFPEGPIFYDKLFNKSPSTRAIDIENKIIELD